MSERMWEELRETRAERDAAIAERDRLRELLDDRSCEAGLYARRMIEAQSARAAVVAERDRLRRELESWREALKSLPLEVVVGSERVPLLYPLPDLIDRLDAILRGES